MQLYTGNGTIIEMVTELQDKSVTPSKTDFFKDLKVNLYENATFLGNKRWADSSWWQDNSDYVAYEMPINEMGMYYTNIMQCTNEYIEAHAGLLLLDSDKNVISQANLPSALLGYDSTGIGIYDNKGSFEITDENVKYLIFWKAKANMPVNPNINTQGYDFLEKNGSFLIPTGYDLTRFSEHIASGVIANVGSTVDGKILEQVGKPNNLYGRRVYVIGDSNMDNWNSANKELFEQRYGCTVTSFASYGATFENTGEDGTSTTGRNSAIGQWNLILEQEQIDAESKMMPEDIAIFFMMGTNCANKGTETDRTNMNVSTALGAMAWVFTQVSYYCRGDVPVGVILPVQSGVGHDNIIAEAEVHGFPYINIEKHARQIQDGVNSSIASESFIVTGNHIAGHGWKHFRRIVHNWMAYCV